jgi:hypothetical protein
VTDAVELELAETEKVENRRIVCTNVDGAEFELTYEWRSILGRQKPSYGNSPYPIFRRVRQILRRPDNAGSDAVGVSLSDSRSCRLH